MFFYIVKQIGKWALTRVFRGCHELETVSLARCPKLGDEELKELGAGCRRLTKLDLRDCNQVNEQGLCAQLRISDLIVSENSHQLIGGSASVAAGCRRVCSFFS